MAGIITDEVRKKLIDFVAETEKKTAPKWIGFFINNPSEACVALVVTQCLTENLFNSVSWDLEPLASFKENVKANPDLSNVWNELDTVYFPAMCNIEDGHGTLSDLIIYLGVSGAMKCCGTREMDPDQQESLKKAFYNFLTFNLGEKGFEGDFNDFLVKLASEEDLPEYALLVFVTLYAFNLEGFRDYAYEAIGKVNASEAGQSTPETPQTASGFSVSDAIKKYKELLDMGAITQEEYDAKKKQLLGL